MDCFFEVVYHVFDTVLVYLRMVSCICVLSFVAVSTGWLLALTAESAAAGAPED